MQVEISSTDFTTDVDVNISSVDSTPVEGVKNSSADFTHAVGVMFLQQIIPLLRYHDSTLMPYTNRN